MSKIILGLDLGTSSIGHTLLSECDKGITILQNGVYILPSNLDKNYITGSQNFKTDNSVRRDNRSVRKRLKSYKKRRKLINTLLKSHLNYDFSKFTNVNDLKVKSLTEEITLNELCAIILNYNKFRGYSELYEDSIEEGNSDYKKSMLKVSEWCDKNNKTVSQYFSEHKNIKLHNIKTPPIKTALYKKELSLILNKQKNYHSVLTTEFINSLITIIY